MKRSRLLTLLGLLLVLGLVAAACGNDDGGSSSEATAAPTEEATEDATEAATEEAGGDMAGVELAQARVEEFRTSPTSIGIDEPVESVEEGLDIVYVQCSVPVCESIREGIFSAGEAIGANVEAITHEDTADTVQAAFQQAIQADPDIVMTSGNPREWFEAELEQLNEAGIPVVAWSIPEPYITDGFAANLITGDDYYFNGVLMADYVTAETNGDANVLFLNIPQFPVLALEGEGFQAEFAEVCPDCTLTAIDITVPQLIDGEHIATAIAELQRDPDINFIVTGFGDMLIGMPEALEGAGVGEGVPAISQAGTPLNYAFIAEESLQVADLGLPTSYLGWRAVDAALRALNGQDPGTFAERPLTDIDGRPDIQIAGLPFQILEVGTVGDPTTAWPGVEGFEEQFRALWGVG